MKFKKFFIFKTVKKDYLALIIDFKNTKITRQYKEEK